MGFRLPGIVHAKKILQKYPFIGPQSATMTAEVPKGYVADCRLVGENEMKRFIIPASCLNQSSFQDLLSQAEEKIGFDHPMGVLTIPCSEDIFTDLISRLNKQ